MRLPTTNPIPIRPGAATLDAIRLIAPKGRSAALAFLLTPPKGRSASLALLLLVLLLPACSEDALPGDSDGTARAPAATASPAAAERPASLAPEQEAFWATLQEHCGNAYRGEVSDATAHYRDGLAGEAVMHVMECTDERIHIPFHLGENRSRNWILTRVNGTIRLKHDHRHADGTEEEISQYGGDAPVPGLPTRQIFPADAHTAAILPERADNFWFFDFAEPETLHYGVHWPKFGHSVRFAFDLSTPVDPPPRPWGY